MPIVLPGSPTPEEEEQARRFQVMMYYLANIALFISHNFAGSGFTFFERLLEAQRQLPGYGRVQRRGQVDAAGIKRRLWLAWGAEVQLRTGYEAKAAFLRYSNVWAPVHAYYAMYMSSHALFAAMGLANPPEDHTASLNTISSTVVPRLLPAPWCVMAVGCPPIGERAFVNLPVDADPDVHVELLSNPQISLFWPRFCKMLETTREKRLERRFKEWKRRKSRTNMFAHEKRAEALKLPPTSLFEFFSRLRIRSNYHDVSSYVMSAVGDQWHEDFHSSLVRSVSSTCLLLESLVVRYAGPDILNQACIDFMGSGAIPGVTKFLEVRRDRILG
ncbi:MAG: hypothetical protein H0V97_00185 [Actinobacteria bacterium]|nr:hypothetical protein [Actinomycetota bacterium]